jgi:hypothetical protein
VSYSMRLDVEGRWSYGPYWEHHDLEIIGLGLAPERVKDKTIKLTFMADRRYPAFIAGIQEAGYEPRCLGGLTVRGQVNEYLGSLPADIIQTLPSSAVFRGYGKRCRPGAQVEISGCAFLIGPDYQPDFLITLVLCERDPVSISVPEKSKGRGNYS